MSNPDYYGYNTVKKSGPGHASDISTPKAMFVVPAGAVSGGSPVDMDLTPVAPAFDMRMFYQNLSVSSDVLCSSEQPTTCYHPPEHVNGGHTVAYGSIPSAGPFQRPFDHSTSMGPAEPAPYGNPLAHDRQAADIFPPGHPAPANAVNSQAHAPKVSLHTDPKTSNGQQRGLLVDRTHIDVLHAGIKPLKRKANSKEIDRFEIEREDFNYKFHKGPWLKEPTPKAQAYKGKGRDQTICLIPPDSPSL